MLIRTLEIVRVSNVALSNLFHFCAISVTVFWLCLVFCLCFIMLPTYGRRALSNAVIICLFVRLSVCLSHALAQQWYILELWLL